jgi:histidyl-tRNA synthetase
MYQSQVQNVLLMLRYILYVIQFGVEAIGAENPSIDAEILAMVMHIYESFGLKHLKFCLRSYLNIGPL